MPSRRIALFCCLLSISAVFGLTPAAVPQSGSQAGPATSPTTMPDPLRLPGKKGVCYSLPSAGASTKPLTQDKIELRQRHIRNIEALNVSWNYSWSMALVDEQPDRVEFMPMVFGGKGLHGPDALAKLTDQLARQVQPHIASGRVRRLLGPNEPDREKHGDLTPEQTLALWPALESMGVPLCSPSAANSEGGKGVGGHWMPEFMAEVERRGLRVDYIGVHAYSETNPEPVKKRLRRIYEKYGRRPLIITEFGVVDWKTLDGVSKNRFNQAQVLAFMKDILPWMERQDWIAGYAWFPFRPDSPHGTSAALFDAAGELTALGRYYRSITPENPDGDQSIQPD
jgi:Glycosyl hydrolase catalytic core